jgi:hypothetical protein
LRKLTLGILHSVKGRIENAVAGLAEPGRRRKEIRFYARRVGESGGRLIPNPYSLVPSPQSLPFVV